MGSYRRYYETPNLETREYRLFRKFEKRPLSWYERTVQLAGGLVRMSPDKRSADRLKNEIAFANLRITPDQVMGTLVVSIIFFAILGVALLVSGIIPWLGGLLVTVLGLPIGYFLFKYPTSLVKAMRIQASSQVVLAVLYMVVSMRISSNLERALRFAASNISGPLAWDLRKLLWDIEVGTYYSAAYALDSYIEKWKSENEEFAEALRLIRDSQTQAAGKTRVILDEALDVILDGTKTRMKHYSQDLQLPIMVIHMMGIVLPIMGSIMAPMAAVFLSDSVQPWHFVLGYDIVLPLVIIGFINFTLAKRPMTFSPIDIRHHPAAPKEGCFRLKGKNVPALPVALLVVLVIAGPAILFYAADPSVLFKGVAQREVTLESLVMSMLLVLGAGLGIAVYSFLTSFQRLGLQEDISSIESEFELALFQLGNRISGGTPTELAIEKAMADVKDLKIRGFFEIILNNIRNLGMTFEQALFDKQYGALIFYPSTLIRNVMFTVVDTAKKGVIYASESMLRIAKYLKNIRETQEYIRDLLEETVNSMKFQAYFLTPIVTGLIVSIAQIIIQVLGKLGTYVEGIGVGSELGLGDLSSLFGSAEASTSPEVFQLIIGIYVIEVIMILGMFLTKINHGNNQIIQRNMTGKMLFVALIVYFLVALFSTVMFSDLIGEALANIGV
ncbi:MAG: type II secretion system F family protein [Candidatus Aenigmarchaeota archaeon]|nr:type II secretion system F family protein [Candidatus Aenigmarchaeota archaeon]